MGIWEILGISPVRDKRQIKRAYAARAKEIHPEDAPEEFGLLYAAYQAALRYAENPAYEEDGGSGLMPNGEESARSRDAHVLQEPEPAETEQGREFDEDVPEREAAKAGQDEAPDGIKQEEDELGAYFDRQAEEREKKIAFFAKKWKEMKWEYGDPEIRMWWKDYLESEDFRGIQWYPEFLKFLVKEMDIHIPYDRTICLFLWEAYGFADSEENKSYIYQEDLGKIRRALYPVYADIQKKKSQELYEKEKQQKVKRNQKRLLYLLLAVAGFVCFVRVMEPLLGRMERRNYVESYMKEKYPEAKFTEPERIKGEEWEIYKIHSLLHPDFTITVEAGHKSNGISVYRVKEDYGIQLLKYYGEQYGVACGEVYRGFYEWPDDREERVGVLYYEDMDTLAGFCDTVVKMFREEEELRRLDTVAVCGKGVLYEDVLINGGTERCIYGEAQFYRPWEMEADEMEEMIRKAFMGYMLRFEAWNISDERCPGWRKLYEEIYEGIKEEQDEGILVTWQEEGNGDIFIPVYGYDLFGRQQSLSTHPYIKSVLSGDAFWYLTAVGKNPERAKDGSGFYVDSYGEVLFFGEEPEVKAEDLGIFLY